MKNFKVLFAAVAALMIVGCSTGAQWEDTAPADLNISAINGLVPLNATFTAEFVKAINVDTLDSNTFFVQTLAGSTAASLSAKSTFDPSLCDAGRGGVIPGEVTTPTDQSGKVTPDNLLTCNTGYVVCVGNDVEYDDGNPYPGFTAPFITVPCDDSNPVDPGDTTAPTVTTVTALTVEPTEERPTNTIFTIAFSEPMEGTTVTANGAITLMMGEREVAGTVVYDAENDSATFTPAAPLASESTYTLKVLGSVTDAAGNEMGSDHTTDYTTGDLSDPTVDGVQLIDNILYIQFSETIDVTTLDGAITVSDGEGFVRGTVEYDAETNVATFTPGSNFAYRTVYTLSIAATVADLAGNELGAEYTWDFSRKEDAIPVVDWIKPQKNKIDNKKIRTIDKFNANVVCEARIPLDKRVEEPEESCYFVMKARFSEKMDPDTITTETFTFVPVNDDGTLPVGDGFNLSRFGARVEPNKPNSKTLFKYLAPVNVIVDPPRGAGPWMGWWRIQVNEGAETLAGVPLAEPYTARIKFLFLADVGDPT